MKSIAAVITIISCLAAYAIAQGVGSQGSHVMKAQIGGVGGVGGIGGAVGGIGGRVGGAVGGVSGGLVGPGGTAAAGGINPGNLPPKRDGERYMSALVSFAATKPLDCEDITINIPGIHPNSLVALGLPANLIAEPHAVIGWPAVVVEDFVSFKRCNFSNPVDGRALKAWRDQPIIIDVWVPKNAVAVPQ